MKPTQSGLLLGLAAVVLPFLGPAAAIFHASRNGAIVGWEYVAALTAVVALTAASIAYSTFRLRKWIFPVPRRET